MNLSSLDTYNYPKEVEWQLDQNNKTDHISLANTINNNASITGVIIQHEYGIFGGSQGDSLLYFMNACTKPMLVTLHTMLPFPDNNMKEVTEKIIKLASSLVVLTQNSKEIVERLYPESIGKTFVIPHGIHDVKFSEQKPFKSKLELSNHIILSTFGLLSRGKGIEHVIQALPDVIKKYPSVLYLILGETHPVILRHEGEKYRLELSELITRLNLEKHVKFYDQYLSLNDLFEFLKATNIYIATSTNPNQAVSGTLSYALGTGRPVISTEFAQSKEIVTPEIGRLVPIQDSRAITSALFELLRDKKKLKMMSQAAYTKTRYMLWSNVAEEYINLLGRTVIPTLKIDHLVRMTDTFGLLQFASLTAPDPHSGYTLDDNARALILCSWLMKQTYTKELKNLMTIYLAFIRKCQQKDGSFINYIDFQHRLPTNQNTTEDLQDAQGRALWALSEVINNKYLPSSMRTEAKKLFITALNSCSQFTHLRTKAFAIKAFALAHASLPYYRTRLLAYINTYAQSLIDNLQLHSDNSWQWFENHLHYSNGLLPESLLIAGDITGRREYTDKAILSLAFLIRKTFSTDMYHPIGQAHWYKKNEQRSHYDQQPEDPAAMILALVRTYTHTKESEYKRLAQICYSWFLGNNTLHTALYDEMSGGCYDGLHPDRLNLNQGAESLLSFLMSSYAIKNI